MPGYPIRKPSDHSSVDSSPRHIAASHVLHRPLMPRHPPCALNNLTNHKHNTKPRKTNTLHKEKHLLFSQMSRTLQKTDARIHYTILKHQPDHPPTQPTYPTTTLGRFGSEQIRTRNPTQRVLPQDPTACRHTTHPEPAPSPFHTPTGAVLDTEADHRRGDSSSSSTVSRATTPVNDRHSRMVLPPTNRGRWGLGAP